MTDRGWVSVERREDVCSEEWEVEVRDHLASSQYTNSRTWKIVEDNRIGY